MHERERTWLGLVKKSMPDKKTMFTEIDSYKGTKQMKIEIDLDILFSPVE